MPERGDGPPPRGERSSAPDDTTPRAFRILLRAYPAAFRRRFSVDMCHTFRARLRDARSRGAPAAGLFWIRTGVHTVLFGLWERLRIVSRGLPVEPHTPDGERRHGAGDRFRDLLTELRLAFRSIRRRPGLALASITALGLGIGLTATTFSIAWGTILRGLPFEDAHELVHFERTDERGEASMAVTPHDYVAWSEEQTSFAGLGAYVEALAHLSDGAGAVRRIWGVYIDPGAFRLLRVEPALGRSFSAEDARSGSADVILLSHRLWQSDFSADSSIVGRTIDLNGGPATVVGVMPAGFGFPIAEQFWRPLRLDLAATTRGEGRLDVFGRLAPGIDLERARAEFEAIGQRLEAAYPATNRDVRPVLRTFHEEYVGPEFTRLVYAMLAGAVLVLLIACANVSNLLAARAMTRTREVAIRTALGAGRWRILAQFLTETAVLAGAGALLGIGLAGLGVRWFAAGVRSGAFDLPHGGDSLFWWQVDLSAVPLLFVLAVTGIVALLAAAAPAARALSTGVGEVLKDEGRGGSSRRLSRFAQGLVVAEIALTTGLVVAAGLMVRSVWNSTAAQRTLDGHGVLTARVALPLEALGLSEEAYPDHERRLAFFDRVLLELRARPGVVAASAMSTLPTSRGGRASFVLSGAPDDPETLPTARIATVSGDFFETFGVQPLEGRTFGEGERPGAPPVAIVNEAFAARHFPGESPIFRQLRLADDEAEPWLTIVGVTPTLLSAGDPGEDLSRIFVPMGQSGIAPQTRLGRWGLRYMTLALRGPGDATVLAPALRDAVASVDGSIPVYDIAGLDDVLARSVARYRIFGLYYVVFGVVALCLSIVGLYAIMAFAVANRRAEIGIRMALGAHAGRILREVLADGLKQVLAGLALGAVIAVWLTSGLSQILYGVDRWDPWIAFGTVGLLVLTGLAACLIPARRAAAVDPNVALHDGG